MRLGFPVIAALLSFISRHFLWFCAAGFAVVVVERVGSMIVFPDRLYTGREWSATFYFANYIDHGFLKRGVLGTLLRPLLQSVGDPQLWVLGVMVVTSLCLLAVVAVLTQVLLPHRDNPGAAATHLIRTAIAIGSAGIPHITAEHGSLDHFGLLLMLAALACLLRGRWIAAALICPVAILLHEAFAVFALPLILAVSWHAAPARGLRRPAVIALLSAPVMLAVLLWGNNQLAADTIPYGVGHRVWGRDLIQYSHSYTISQIIAVTRYWLAILTLIFSVWRANQGRFDWVFLAMLSPLALNVLGVDHARWVGLGFFVAVTGFGVMTRLGCIRMPRLNRWQIAGTAILCLPLGPLSQVHPLPWLL